MWSNYCLIYMFFHLFTVSIGITEWETSLRISYTQLIFQSNFCWGFLSTILLLYCLVRIGGKTFGIAYSVESNRDGESIFFVLLLWIEVCETRTNSSCQTKILILLSHCCGRFYNHGDYGLDATISNLLHHLFWPTFAIGWLLPTTYGVDGFVFVEQTSSCGYRNRGMKQSFKITIKLNWSKPFFSIPYQ